MGNAKSGRNDGKYPSGGNYPETKDDWVEHFFRLCQSATPQQMQRATSEWLALGGKFALIAKVVMGEIAIKELDKRLAELE